MNDKIVRLRDQITVTLSPKATRLVRAEIERQKRDGREPQTPEQIVEEGTIFVCEAMASPSYKGGAA